MYIFVWEKLGATSDQHHFNLSKVLHNLSDPCNNNIQKKYDHTSYLPILVHRRIIEVYKKYTKKLSELATK